MEEFKNIPFVIKRIYYIYDIAPNVIRGLHAHKKLEQVLICVHGSCNIKLDDGKETKIVKLENPYEGLYLSSGIWREMMEFTEWTVLMVIASEPYDEDDYIRDYEEFLEYMRESR